MIRLSDDLKTVIMVIVVGIMCFGVYRAQCVFVSWQWYSIQFCVKNTWRNVNLILPEESVVICYVYCTCHHWHGWQVFDAVTKTRFPQWKNLIFHESDVIRNPLYVNDVLSVNFQLSALLKCKKITVVSLNTANIVFRFQNKKKSFNDLWFARKQFSSYFANWHSGSCK